MHVALQGCLRARDVPYGLTPDTGGHIKYLLELVAAAEAQNDMLEQQIIVRRFNDEKLGGEYACERQRISDRAQIIRIPGATEAYVAKEDLRFELPILADNLEAHIRTLPKRPNIIHAHYADAGQLAVEMKRRVGIPFIFTAHSLGRVKSASQPSSGSDPILAARIAMEEDVIAAADRIIASSMDEAELQYGLYQSARPEIIRVNPPGCDLETFAEQHTIRTEVEKARDKFLKDSKKPLILALARPVTKKNLAGLVRAYGQNKALQEASNLVIYAGTRTLIDAEDTEPCAVLTELLKLIDDYDLWGKVALPKSHRQSDVPAIYQDAYRRGGVFANVALNEPFGLTFLEAAASGLPVIATNSGGPNDILERCRNGQLVDPMDPAAIGDAILELLTNGHAWEVASHNGLEACSYYSWDRHACEYLQDIAWLASNPSRPAAVSKHYRSMLVCDIDNTLTGDRLALERLKQWLTINSSTAYGIATGRSLQSAINIIGQWNIPVPQFLITSVGSEIYWVQDLEFRDLVRDTRWPPLGPIQWNPDAIETSLGSCPRLEPQAPQEQRRFKRSYFLEDIARCSDVRKTLDRHGLEFELIYSHGRFLDILPKGVSKGHAIHHVAASLGVDPSEIWAAGDSGNDTHMLEMVGHPIIVGNHTTELDHLKAKPHSYFSKANFAAGVVEGLLRGASGLEKHDS